MYIKIDKKFEQVLILAIFIWTKCIIFTARCISSRENGE